jgi:hypothetical protein
MTVPRPAVPDEILRAVRQRCAFGCVLCGAPIYEYEHMLGWANVQRHVAEEMTLLCHQHHGEKTRGILPMEVVRSADADPYNRRTGVSKNVLLRYSGENVRVHLGNSTFEYTNLPEGAVLAPIVIDGVVMVGFKVEQQQLLLEFKAFNEFNRRILAIVNNELFYDTTQWNIEWVGTKLTIREARRKIILQLIFAPPADVTISRGRIMRNGIELLVGPRYLFDMNGSNLFLSTSTRNVPVGFCIGYPTILGGVAFSNPDVSRYKFDRLPALRFLRRSMSRLRKRQTPT